jgi:formylmethanofuran dehydrogenase subunit D
MIVNTVRIIDYDQAREHTFGDEKTLKEKLAIGIIHPDDFKKLNLNSSLNLKVSTKYGTVVLKCITDEDTPKGMIVIPISIWANQITGIENSELIFKNIDSSVESTRESVLDFEDLINKIKSNSSAGENNIG